MHIKNSVLLASAALAPIALAQDGAAASNITRINFVPSNVNAPFLEQFTDDWETRWQASHAKKDTKSDEEEWAYVGTWKVEEPLVYKGLNGDKGLVLKDKAAHHAISAKFPTVIDNKGKSLVVQYEVKLQDLLECGGAYMKLLQENAALHAEEFSNASPYVIMFGPDKCGSTNKVHFIFKHKNPVTGEYEEKHMTKPVSMKNEKTTTLYTLIVDPDQTYEVKINGERVASGSLLEDFAPAVNPAAEIDDPNDTKPLDWVDDAKITDASATKPADWDEDAPAQIVDETAEKPADWLENEPQMVPDPEAEKPEDWDDEEDGDFVAPMVPNPRCAEVSGCGPWEKPMIKNEAYKGKWYAPLIDNPLYKGIWGPAKIANPAYFEDKTPSNFGPIGGIGFEIWTMQKDILFDNIYVGYSIEEALRLKSETFDLKLPIELEEAEAAKPKVDPKATPNSPLDLNFMDDPVLYVREKVELFITLFQRDPMQAIQFVPEVAGGIAVLVVSLLALIFGGIFGGAAAAPQVKQAATKAKEKVKEATNQPSDKDLKDQAADAIATGAENARAEAKKRQTRSSGAVDGTS